MLASAEMDFLLGRIDKKLQALRTLLHGYIDDQLHAMRESIVADLHTIIHVSDEEAEEEMNQEEGVGGGVDGGVSCSLWGFCHANSLSSADTSVGPHWWDATYILSIGPHCWGATYSLWSADTWPHCWGITYSLWFADISVGPHC